MSLPLITQPPKIGCGDPGDPIDFSGLFDGGQHMAFTPTQSGNGNVWATSFWEKRTKLGDRESIFSYGSSGAGMMHCYYYQDRFSFYDSESNEGSRSDAGLSRDPASWKHHLLVFNNTLPIAQDRYKHWINGVLNTDFYVNTAFQQNKSMKAFQAGQTQFIGLFRTDQYFLGDMKLADYHGLDGIEPTPEDFGYFNSDGHWVPRTYSGSHGLQGWHHDFADPLDLGKDVSGNGNHFTSPGMTPANQSRDTPTNNKNTWNPLDKETVVSLQQGNLKVTAPAGAHHGVRSTIPIPPYGKWYAESTFYRASTSELTFGLATLEHPLTTWGGYSDQSWAIDDFGRVRTNSVDSYTGVPFTNESIVARLAYDAETGNLWIGQDNTWFGGGDPELGTNPTFSGIPEDVFFWASAANSSTQTTRFSEDQWTIAVPNGFKSLSTPNLECPEILDPDDYFTIREVSAGDDVSDLPWNPLSIKTMVLSKRIDGSTEWRVVDTVNGAGKAWATNTPAAQIIEADGLTSFTAGGYTVGANAAYQGIRKDYIWRASPKSGFDIVQINHVNGTPSTVSHNCGGPIDYAWLVPHSGGNRRIFHKKLPTGKYAHLNVATTPATDSGWFSSTANDVTINGSLPSGIYTLPIWRGVAQFSSFDGHKGNQSADGPFETKDFTPRLMFCRKSAYGESNWMQEIGDSNPQTKMRYLNDPAGEYSHASGYSIDFDSNGLKWRTADTSWNASGVDFITASWAKTPFKFARAR